MDGVCRYRRDCLAMLCPLTVGPMGHIQSFRVWGLQFISIGGPCETTEKVN